MSVTTSNGYSYKIPLQLPQSVVADKFVSGDGKTTLDTSNNHIDETHLLLHGDLPAGHSYIKCEKSNGDIPFKVDYQGITTAKDIKICLLYTSPSPRDVEESRMPSSA